MGQLLLEETQCTCRLNTDNTAGTGTDGSTDHITLYCKNSVCQTLHCNPFYRHFSYPALPVVIATVDLLRQPKVCDTHCHVITQPVRQNQKQEKQIRLYCLIFKKATKTTIFVTYMQLRAARSRCRKLRPLRYSIPKAMSTMNFKSVWVGKNCAKKQTRY